MRVRGADSARRSRESVKYLDTPVLSLLWSVHQSFWFFFFQAEDGIRDYKVTGVQTCALPICIEPHGFDLIQIFAPLSGASGIERAHHGRPRFAPSVPHSRGEKIGGRGLGR